MSEVSLLALPPLPIGPVCKLCELPVKQTLTPQSDIECSTCHEKFHYECFDRKMQVKKLVVHKRLELISADDRGDNSAD